MFRVLFKKQIGPVDTNQESGRIFANPFRTSVLGSKLPIFEY